VAEERQAQLHEEERKRQRELHFMKCPKCGMQLEEITFGDIRIDKCFNCEGVAGQRGIGKPSDQRTRGNGQASQGFSRVACRWRFSSSMTLETRSFASSMPRKMS
jgi:Transcription factor zinc-finger